MFEVEVALKGGVVLTLLNTLEFSVLDHIFGDTLYLGTTSELSDYIPQGLSYQDSLATALNSALLSLRVLLLRFITFGPLRTSPPSSVLAELLSQLLLSCILLSQFNYF